MSVAKHLQEYLCKEGARYDVYPHHQTENFLQAAEESHIPSDQLIKGVVMEDDKHRRVMALIPALNKVDLRRLSKQMKRRLHLVPREKLRELFPDCEDHAVPPVGQAYAMKVIWDEQLLQMDDIYLDEGDHRGFLHMKRDGFMALMTNEKHGQFSYQSPIAGS